MSTDYFFADTARFDEVVEEAPTLGIRVTSTPESLDRNAVILSDGENFIWLFKTRDGGAQMTKFGGNDPKRILDKLRESFGTIYSEYEVGHWREEIGG